MGGRNGDVNTLSVEREGEDPVLEPQSWSSAPEPRYPPVGGTAILGWARAVAILPDEPVLLALDRPAVVDWPGVIRSLALALREHGLASSISICARAWSRGRRSSSAPDPTFSRTNPDLDKLAPAP